MELTTETLNDATQFATIYRVVGQSDGTNVEVPVATAIRRRVYESGPAWRIYDTDGSLIGRVWQTRQYDWLRNRIEAIVLADLVSRV